jgi:hypothetical protein
MSRALMDEPQAWMRRSSIASAEFYDPQLTERCDQNSVRAGDK